MGATEGQPTALPRDTLYRYRDAQGVEHLVQGLDEVPQQHMASAQPVEGGVQVDEKDGLQRAKDEVELRSWQAQGVARDVAFRLFGRHGQAFGPNAPSFLLGGGVVLALVLGVSALKRGRMRPLRLVMAIAFAAVAAGAYLWGIRPGAGPAIEGATTPIEAARQAAEAVKRSTAEQQRAIEEIDRSSR